MGVFMAAYVGFNATTSDFQCPICLEGNPSKKSNLVAHKGPNGSLHPMHKNCARNCAQRMSVCPVCRESIDPDSLARFAALQQIWDFFVKSLEGKSDFPIYLGPPF